MRTETRKIYLFPELSQEAQSKAIRAEYAIRADSGLPWEEEEEMRESYSAILNALDLGVDRDGDPQRFPKSVGLLQGSRAIAWAENNLLGPLRIPWTGETRAKLRKHGRHYYAGRIRPCPWTGFYADEVFLDAFMAAVRKGESLDDAAQELPAAFRKMAREEWDHYLSDETIREDLYETGAEFLESGARP